MQAKLHNICVFQGNTSSVLLFSLKNVTNHEPYLNDCVSKIVRSRDDESDFHTIGISILPDKSKIILDLSIPETIPFTHAPEDLQGIRKLEIFNPNKLPGEPYYWDLKFQGSQIFWGAFIVLQNVA